MCATRWQPVQATRSGMRTVDAQRAGTEDSAGDQGLDGGTPGGPGVPWSAGHRVSTAVTQHSRRGRVLSQALTSKAVWPPECTIPRLGVSVEACSFRFWKVRDEERAAMNIPLVTGFEDGRHGLPDVPLIVEDLLCQVEELRAVGGDPAVVADLLAQVDLLQGR